jgi:hypothetical protein
MSGRTAPMRVSSMRVVVVGGGRRRRGVDMGVHGRIIGLFGIIPASNGHIKL